MFVAAMLATSVNAQTQVKGDMNGDGKIDVDDVDAVVNVLLGNAPVVYIDVSGNAASPMLVKGDMNDDGEITLVDLTAVVNVFVGNAPLEYINPPQPVVPHEYVDLGLPSHTLWATCNVGAENPEDIGDYFAWGETVPYGKMDSSNAMNHAYNNGDSFLKEFFAWSTYKYCDGTYKAITKYCNQIGYGFMDNKAELDPEDDAAYVNWGSDWRMPSLEQIEELAYGGYTTKAWTIVNGVNGLKITSQVEGFAGRSIFLPATGRRNGNILEWADIGYFWSRTLSSPPYNADGMECDSYPSTNSLSYARCLGQCVRPVRVSE